MCVFFGFIYGFMMLPGQPGLIITTVYCG